MCFEFYCWLLVGCSRKIGTYLPTAISAIHLDDDEQCKMPVGFYFWLSQALMLVYLWCLCYQNHIYWPVDKGQSVTHGPFTISLQSVKDKQTWVERILSVTHKAVSKGSELDKVKFALIADSLYCVIIWAYSTDEYWHEMFASTYQTAPDFVT